MSPKNRLSAASPACPPVPPLTLIRTPFDGVRDALREPEVTEACDMDDLSRVASELVRCWGRAATIEALLAERHVAEPSALPSLVTLIQLFGEDPGLPPLPPGMRRNVVQAARELAAELEDGEEGAWGLAVRIFEMPLPTREAVWEGVRREAADQPTLKTLAFMLLMFPIDEALRLTLERWVAEAAGPAATSLLEALLHGERDGRVQARLRQRLMSLRNRSQPAAPCIVPGIPLDWPFRAAFLTRDANGSGDLVVARTRPDGRIAMFMGAWEGAILRDASGILAMSVPEYRKFRDALEGPLQRCSPCEALARIDKAVAALEQEGFPIPFGLQVSRFLLIGL